MLSTRYVEHFLHPAIDAEVQMQLPVLPPKGYLFRWFSEERKVRNREGEPSARVDTPKMVSAGLRRKK